MSKTRNNQANGSKREGNMNDRIEDAARSLQGREGLSDQDTERLISCMRDSATEAEHDGYGGYDAAIEAAIEWLRS